MVEKLLSAVFGVVFALIPELVPGFASKWDALSDEWKRAIRAYIGGGIVVALALLQYAGGVALGFPETFDINAVISIAVSWVAFVLVADGTYQVGGPFWPRKQEK